MTTNETTQRRVWSIPWARSFEPVARTILWHIEDFETGAVIGNTEYATKAECDAAAAKIGTVVNPEGRCQMNAPNATLRGKDVYIGMSNVNRTSDRERERYHVLGGAFGPMLLCADCLLSEAIDEFDERHGERVNPVADAATLADYDGETVAEQVDDAMNHGDIRVNDGGTTVWVDHYEWYRSFRTGREAGRFFRGHA